MSTKKAVKLLHIDIKHLQCPNCKTTGQYTTENHETICKECGLIITTPYPYTAGIKFKTLTEYQIEKGEQKKWKQTT